MTAATPPTEHESQGLALGRSRRNDCRSGDGRSLHREGRNGLRYRSMLIAGFDEGLDRLEDVADAEMALSNAVDGLEERMPLEGEHPSDVVAHRSLRNV